MRCEKNKNGETRCKTIENGETRCEAKKQWGAETQDEKK